MKHTTMAYFGLQEPLSCFSSKPKISKIYYCFFVHVGEHLNSKYLYDTTEKFQFNCS